MRMMTLESKSYSQLILLPTMLERFEYLRLDGLIGDRTFGGDRYLNQALYTSAEWKQFRNSIIIRDNGCDMAMPGFDIIQIFQGKPLKRRSDYIIIHHINPLLPKDIRKASSKIFDQDNVVCVSPNTHRAIHYGDASLLPQEYTPRSPNDTCPWRH